MRSKDQDEVTERIRGITAGKKVLVILSGGLDSSVLLAQFVSWGDRPRALSVDYGQRHRKEIESAKRVCQHLGVTHEVGANLSALRPLLTGSSQTDDWVSVPEGHYAEESMKATIVPNRNMILLAVAGARALSTGCETVAYGAHAGDHAIYPDCRPEFAEAVDKVLGLADWKPLHLTRPFVHLRKTDIVALGASLNFPMKLTWSCYKGGERHCGKCGICVERREAFKLANVSDPTDYE